MTANLTSEQQKALQEVMVLADQRKAAAESKRIEQSGGKCLLIQCRVCSSHNSVAEDVTLSIGEKLRMFLRIICAPIFMVMQFSIEDAGVAVLGNT